MPYKEIAEHLDITLNTVEAHMTKAYERCQTYVDKQLQEKPLAERQVAVKASGRRGGQ